MLTLDPVKNLPQSFTFVPFALKRGAMGRNVQTKLRIQKFPNEID